MVWPVGVTYGRQFLANKCGSEVMVGQSGQFGAVQGAPFLYAFNIEGWGAKLL